MSAFVKLLWGVCNKGLDSMSEKKKKKQDKHIRGNIQLQQTLDRLLGGGNRQDPHVKWGSVHHVYKHKFTQWNILRQAVVIFYFQQLVNLVRRASLF